VLSDALGPAIATTMKGLILHTIMLLGTLFIRCPHSRNPAYQSIQSMSQPTTTSNISIHSNTVDKDPRSYAIYKEAPHAHNQSVFSMSNESNSCLFGPKKPISFSYYNPLLHLHLLLIIIIIIVFFFIFLLFLMRCVIFWHCRF
jgi:hypothetical protein